MPAKKKSMPAPRVPERRTMAGEQEFRVWLRAYCEAFTSKAVARKHKLSQSQLSNLLAGRASIGPVMAARFGFQRLDSVTFIPADKEQS